MRCTARSFRLWHRLDTPSSPLTIRNNSSPLKRPDENFVFEVNITDNIEFAANVRQADVLWQLGTFGHSLGGGAASLAMQDKATLYKDSASLNGAFFSQLNKAGFRGPLFHMAANKTCRHSIRAETWPRISSWKQAVKINETTHVSYCDLIAMINRLPEDASQDVRTLAPGRMTEIVVVYLKAFWDWTLLGKEIDDFLLHEPHLYPETSFEGLELHESPESFCESRAIDFGYSRMQMMAMRLSIRVIRALSCKQI